MFSGCLSDICKAQLRIEVNDRNPFVQNFFIKIVPSQLQQLVTRHRLFDREILLYRFLLPEMLGWARRRNPDLPLQLQFRTPRLLYGDVDPAGAGVVVLEDLSSRGYSTVDPRVMLLGRRHMTAAVTCLAEFHGLALAYDLCQGAGAKLADRYPLLCPENVMWYQEDMEGFLRQMFHTSHRFLRSLPGEEELSRCEET